MTPDWRHACLHPPHPWVRREMGGGRSRGRCCLPLLQSSSIVVPFQKRTAVVSHTPSSVGCRVCWYTYVSGCFRKFMFGFSRLMKNGGALSCSGIIAHSLFWSLVPLSVFVVSSLDTFTHFLFFTHALLMGHKTSWRTHSVAGTLLQYHAWWNLDVSLFVPQTNKPPTVPFLLPLHLII